MFQVLPLSGFSFYFFFFGNFMVFHVVRFCFDAAASDTVRGKCVGKPV